MEQIVIQVRSKEKAKILLEMLKALNFVDEVNVSHKEVKVDATTQRESLDFFSLAGLWEDRDIGLTSVRQQAWPRQSS